MKKIHWPLWLTVIACALTMSACVVATPLPSDRLPAQTAQQSRPTGSLGSADETDAPDEPVSTDAPDETDRPVPCEHKPVTDEAVAPTCTETGLTEGSHCSACHEVLRAQETVPALGHTEAVLSAVAPTCTAEGKTEGKYCTVCGEVLIPQETVAALAHTEVVDAAVAPTCTEAGKTAGKHCSVCQTVLVVRKDVPATGHDEVVDAAVAPTCTEAGKTAGKHCSVCQTVLVAREVVPATGHDEVVDAAVAPTCKATGLTEGSHCSRCSEILVAQTVVDRADHTIVEHICQVCGYDDRLFHDPTLYASDYGYTYLGTLAKGAAMQAYYDRLNRAAEEFHTDSSLDAEGDEIKMLPAATAYGDLGLTYVEAEQAWLCMLYDHPLYYWVANQWTYSDVEGWIRICVEPAYALGSVRAAQNEAIYTAAEAYHAATDGEESEYLTALAYHDMIISAIDYAYESDGETPEDEKWAHSVVGVFNGAGAVCEGYAKAFQLLLNASGIENVFVVGDTNGIGHAWNLVRLDDGEWYWFDLTWDDQETAFRRVIYNYFAVNDTQAVEWSDAHHGAQVPDVRNGAFTDSHEGLAMNPYALPARSETVFDDHEIIELRETFTVDDRTYALVGYGEVQLISTRETGTLRIADTVEYDGRTYRVVSVGGYEDGYFIQGEVSAVGGIVALTVDGGVLNIDMGAFMSCETLERLELSEGVESVDHLAFWGCTALTELIIPKSVTSLGLQAFAYCFGLEEIEFGGTVDQWNAIEKGEGWNQDCGTLIVRCADGNVTV